MLLGGDVQVNDLHKARCDPVGAVIHLDKQSEVVLE